MLYAQEWRRARTCRGEKKRNDREGGNDSSELPPYSNYNGIVNRTVLLHWAMPTKPMLPRLATFVLTTLTLPRWFSKQLDHISRS